MRALCRYVASDVARSQSWVPPFLVYAVLCLVDVAIGGADRGNALPNFATNAAFLLPVAIWGTVVVGNCEDPVQAAITVATTGSETKVRLAKLLVAFAGSGLLAVFSTFLVWATSGLPSAGVTLEGFAAHITTTLAGVGVGSLCMRPVLDRRAWAVLIGVLASLGDVLVPQGPPVRQLLVLLDASRPSHLVLHLAVVALESALIACVLVALSLPAGRLRT
jgi:hypothetical protein